MRVTQVDILEAMRAAMGAPEAADDGFTGPELRERIGCGLPTFTRHLKRMLATGQAEVVTVKRQGMDGRQMTLRGYRLKAKAKRDVR